MSFLWAGFELTICFIESVLFYYFIIHMQDVKKKYSRDHRILGLFLLTCLSFLMTYIELFSLEKVIIGWVVHLLYAFVFLDGIFWKKFLYITLFFGLLGLSDFSTSSIMILITNESYADISIIQNIFRVYIMIISKTITFIFCYIVVNIKRKDIDDYIPRRYRFVFVLIFSITVVAILVLTNTMVKFQESNLVAGTLVVFASILFLVYGLAYYLFIKMCATSVEINEKNMLAYQNELLNKQALRAIESKEEIRFMVHDMKHYLTSLQTYLEEGEIEAALKFIRNHKDDISAGTLLYAGIPIVTALINQLHSDAYKNKAKFIFEGAVKDFIQMDHSDVGSLLGNIFDNALEATIKISDETRREITVKFTEVDKYLTIDVTNTYEIEPIAKGNVFITRKENRTEHGIGMKSIKRIVKKYDGEVEYDYANGHFKVFIILPVYSKTY